MFKFGAKRHCFAIYAKGNSYEKKQLGKPFETEIERPETTEAKKGKTLDLQGLCPGEIQWTYCKRI